MDTAARGTAPRWVTAPADRPPPNSYQQQQVKQHQPRQPQSSAASTITSTQPTPRTPPPPASASASVSAAPAAAHLDHGIDTRHSTPRTTPVLSKSAIETAKGALEPLTVHLAPQPLDTSTLPDTHTVLDKYTRTASSSPRPAANVAATSSVNHTPPDTVRRQGGSDPLRTKGDASSPRPPSSPTATSSAPATAAPNASNSPSAVTAAASVPPKSNHRVANSTTSSPSERDTSKAPSSARRHGAAPSIGSSPPPRSPLTTTRQAARPLRHKPSMEPDLPSPAPMPPYTPQPASSAAAAAAATEPPATPATPVDPPKRTRRRGWKGWAIEVEDENGHIYVRSPSPEPERPVDAPPRKRGRPRTRPRPEEPVTAQPEADPQIKQEEGRSSRASAPATAHENGPSTANGSDPIDSAAGDGDGDSAYSPASSESVRKAKRAKRRSSPVERREKRPRASVPAAIQTHSLANRPRRSSAATSGRKVDEALTSASTTAAAESVFASASATVPRSATERSGRPQTAKQSATKDKAIQRTLDEFFHDDVPEQDPEQESDMAQAVPRLGMGVVYPSPPESDERHGPSAAGRARKSGTDESSYPNTPRTRQLPPVKEEALFIIESTNRREEQERLREEEEARVREQQQREREAEEKEKERQARAEELRQRERERERERELELEKLERERERHTRERHEWERAERGRWEREEWERRRDRERGRERERERDGEYAPGRDERDWREREHVRQRVVYDERGREVIVRDARDEQRGAHGHAAASSRESHYDARSNGRSSHSGHSGHSASAHSQPYYPPPPHEYRHSPTSSYHPSPYERRASYRAPPPPPPPPPHHSPFPPYPSPSHLNSPLQPDGRDMSDYNYPRHMPGPHGHSHGPSSLNSHNSHNSHGRIPPAQSPLLTGPPPLGPPRMQPSPISQGSGPPALPPIPKIHPGTMGDHPMADRHSHDQHQREHRGDRRMSSHSLHHARPDRRNDMAGREMVPELRPDVHADPRDPRDPRTSPLSRTRPLDGREPPLPPRAEFDGRALTKPPTPGYTSVVPVPFPTGPAYRAPEPRPPHLDPQSAAIVLAPPANQHASPPKRNDLTFHRAYMSGLEGLDPHLEENARGFVENVKNNLRTLVQTYFSSEPTSSRDAFLERIGRDLTSFGYELTDSADGALYTRGAVPPLALPAFVPSPSVSNADPETPRRIRDDPMDGRDRERDYRMSNMRK